MNRKRITCRKVHRNTDATTEPRGGEKKKGLPGPEARGRAGTERDIRGWGPANETGQEEVGDWLGW